MYTAVKDERREEVRINEFIRAKEVRVIGPNGENFGILPIKEALAKARGYGLDLIEITAKANPPVTRIMDYGKFQYERKKKAREVRRSARTVETKIAQVKIGTSEHDRRLKAQRIAEWLEEGHRVKVDLFLFGRYKYMDENFLKERLQQFLAMIPVSYKIADEIKKGPKGYTVTIEPAKGS
ncbi:translation initiation factor IF-3 [Candidatus Parcubacteria bacterium]|jgi:translation initiation factor IF-3|nr:MAG: translation initiation factor IF-3 [Candidatus Parcubacteria bacterium]